MKILFSILLGLLSMTSWAQDTLYFDLEWDDVSTRDSATYYRLISQTDNGLYAIRDYYIQGALQMEGYTTDPNKDLYEGEAVWYDAKGKKTLVRDYQHGKILSAESYLPTGERIASCTYQDGQPYNGRVFTQSRSQINSYYHYVEGQEVSWAIFYKNSLHKAWERFLIPRKHENDIDLPAYDIFYRTDGSVIDTLFYSADPVFHMDHGRWVDFYQDRYDIVSIQAITTYENQARNGPYQVFKKNGDLWLEGIYRDWEPYEGDFLRDNIQTTYKEGVRQGKLICYDDDLNIISEATVVDGIIMDGTIKNYHTETTYSDGVMIEKIDYFDSQFKIPRSKTFFDGKFSTTTTFDANGNILSMCTYDGIDPIDGMDINYHTHTPYKNGQKDGMAIEYSSEDDHGISHMIKKTLYDQDNIVHMITWDPVTHQEHLCQYQYGQPYDGMVFGEYDGVEYAQGKRIRLYRIRQDYETKKYSYQEITEYNPENSYEVLKRITFHKKNEYTVTYKNGTPYSGQVFDYDELTTYQDGERHGLYQKYDNDHKIEQGQYVHGLKEGTIVFTPLNDSEYICAFKNGKPWTGIALEGNTRNSYLQGEKHGMCFIFSNQFTIHQMYDHGKKEGEYTCFYNGEKLQGTFKNDLPFNGTFLDQDNDTFQHYINGKKDGTFISNAYYLSTQTIDTYAMGNLQSTQVIYTENDSTIALLHYQENKPYEGLQYTWEDSPVVLTPYHNGLIHGLKKTYVLSDVYDIRWILAEQVNYQNGQKVNDYFKLLDPENSPSEKIQGSYRNGKPLEGQFEEIHHGITILTRYKNGNKTGLETYQYQDQTYEMLYSNGKKIKGQWIEYYHQNKEEYYFLHTYDNGQFTITQVLSQPDVSIHYYPNQMVIKTTNNQTTITFDNKEKSKGTFSVQMDGDDCGTIAFENNQITSGQIISTFENFTSTLMIEDNQLTIKSIFSSFPDLYYYHVFDTNVSPETWSYHNYYNLVYGGINWPENAKTDIFLGDHLLASVTLDGFVIKDGIFIELLPYDPSSFRIMKFRHGEIIAEKQNVSFEDLEKQLATLRQE